MTKPLSTVTIPPGMDCREPPQKATDISIEDLPVSCGNCPVDKGFGHEHDCAWPDCVRSE